MAILQHLAAMGATILHLLTASMAAFQHRLIQLKTFIQAYRLSSTGCFICMMVVQLAHAFMQIGNKVALDKGLNPLVLVFYRQVFATLFIAPVAYFLEWEELPPITWPIVGYLGLCTLCGIVGNQCLFVLGLKYTTPTTASAISNILPGITFVMSFIFRQESPQYTIKSRVAKIVGTVVAIAGSMVTTFYKSRPVIFKAGVLIPQILQNLYHQDKQTWIGPILVIGSCVSTAGWLILLGRMRSTFDRPCTMTAVTGFFGAVLTGIIAASVEHHGGGWSLSSAYRWGPAVYSGAIGSAFAFFLMTICTRAKGGLYVSIFGPVMLVMIAFLRWFLQNELIFLGNLLGALLILLGFSLVQWGLLREERLREEEEERVRRIEEANSLELL